VFYRHNRTAMESARRVVASFARSDTGQKWTNRVKTMFCDPRKREQVERVRAWASRKG
jgi:hypothetical protein